MKYFNIRTISVLLLSLFNINAFASAVSADICRPKSPANCNNKVICVWMQHIPSQTINREASRRGLSCAKPIIKRSTPRTPLHTAFLSLSLNERRLVQEELTKLNLYDSTIDGLFGPRTSKAIVAYNNEYFGNVDIEIRSESKELIAGILRGAAQDQSTHNVTKKDLLESQDNQIQTITAEPKTINDLATYFEDQDYKSALAIAQELAITGDAEAQAYLGKMYADGLGTLQLSKNAHMWFNIASLNGSTEAITERNAVAETMTASAVEEAQELALKCIQSNYADCGLLVKKSTTETASPNPRGLIENGDVLISDFKDQSSLRRKQLQYALNKLGLYSSKIDGLWGSNTSKAFTNYMKINDLDAKDAEEVFVSILSKVDVPSSFTPPKKKQTVIKQTTENNLAKETPRSKSGWIATSQNPKLSFEDAKDICNAKAVAEGNSYLSANKPIDRYSSIDCTGYGFNSYSCSRSSGGGVAGGILRAWDEADNVNAAKNLAKAVAKACMADYGWIKK